MAFLPAAIHPLIQALRFSPLRYNPLTGKPLPCTLLPIAMQPDAVGEMIVMQCEKTLLKNAIVPIPAGHLNPQTSRPNSP